MRYMSPLLTIPTSASVSNGIHIGNARIVGIVPVAAGDMTDAEKLTVQELVDGRLTDPTDTDIWKVVKRVNADGTVSVVGPTGAAWEVAGSSFHFSAVDNDGLLTMPDVRIAAVNATTGAAGTNPTTQITARLILEPHR